MKTKIAVIGLLVALAAGSVFGISKMFCGNTACPRCGSDSYFTGVTDTDPDTGKELYQFKCYEYGHVFWIPQD